VLEDRYKSWEVVKVLYESSRKRTVPHRPGAIPFSGRIYAIQKAGPMCIIRVTYGIVLYAMSVFACKERALVLRVRGLLRLVVILSSMLQQ
jgi:hypothetical protein